MDDRGKLAFLKQAYKKLEKESGARELELKEIQQERDAQHERERHSFELQTGELQAELEKANNLWRSLKEENERMKQLLEKSPQPTPGEKGGPEVSALDRMANAFKNIGRVDWEKECVVMREQMEKLAAELEAKNAAHSELEAKLAVHETEASEARVALEELTHARTGESSQLESQLQALQTQLAETQTALEAKLAELDACRGHLESSKHREDRLREDYNEEQRKNSALRHEKHDLGQQLSATQEQLSTLQAAAQELESRIEQMQAEHAEQLRAQEAALTERIRALENPAGSTGDHGGSALADLCGSGPEEAALFELLQDSNRLSELRDYARQEDAERYLMFWQDVKDFTELTEAVDDPEVLHQTAEVIYSKYLSSSAESRIDVEQEICAEIQRRSNDVLADLSGMFVAAQAQVFEFLSKEVYPGFLVAGQDREKKPSRRRKKPSGAR